MSKLTPVFYLGENRNGTTLLGNTLVNNFDLAAPSHEIHYGILENFLIGTKKRYNFNDENIYSEFINIYSTTDFFILANGDKSYFEKNRQKDFYHFFLEMMDQYALSQGKYCWCTKLEPLFFLDEPELSYFLEIVEKRYGDFKLISIERDTTSFLKSSWQLAINQKEKRNTPLSKILYITQLSIRKNILYRFRIPKLINSDKCLKLIFEEMIKNRKYCELQIEKHIGRKCQQTNVTYKKNTSFDTKKGDLNLPIWINTLFLRVPFLLRILSPIYISLSKKKNTQKIFWWKLQELK